MISSIIVVNDDKTVIEDDFQESRIYATLHALCLHSLVKHFSSYTYYQSACLFFFFKGRTLVALKMYRKVTAIVDRAKKYR